MNNEFHTQIYMLNWRKELVKGKFLQFKWKNCYYLENSMEIKAASAAFIVQKSSKFKTFEVSNKPRYDMIFLY